MGGKKRKGGKKKTFGEHELQFAEEMQNYGQSLDYFEIHFQKSNVQTGWFEKNGTLQRSNEKEDFDGNERSCTCIQKRI